MSEQEQITQLSALFDGELPSEQAGMVIRRALKDPALRASWGRYALIGACLRGEPLGAVLPGNDLAGRVRARLATEVDHSAAESASVAATAAASARRALLGRGAVGGAIAAGVALVSLLIFRSMGPVLPAQGAPVQVAQAEAAAAPEAVLVAQQVSRPAGLPATRDSLPPSYTTPVDNSPRGSPLMNYFGLHSEVAASAVRFSPMSSVINSSYDPTQGAVEMSAAEVGARR